MTPTEPLILAIVATVIGPVLVAIVTYRQRRADRREDYARQDAVAARAEQAAKDLLVAQNAAIGRTNEVARLAAEEAERATRVDAETKAALALIHTLVNSDMTAARQAELNQTEITLHTLRRVLVLGRAKGEEPSEEDLAAIRRTQERILELRAILADRLAQQRLAETQQAVAVDGGTA